MIKSYSRILNEGFSNYFKRLEESVQTIYDEYRNMTKEPIIEFPNGDYFYVVVDPETKSIYAGSATNTGVFREFEIAIDEDGTLDSNLEALYDYMIEENPELTYDAEDIENTNKYYDSLTDESLKESSDDGNIGESIKKKVKDLYNQEISKDDKKHSIDKDGYGFTIIRKNGKKLVYDGSKGKFINTKNESKNSKRLSESMKDANKAEIELYSFLDKWVKKYSEFLDMETLSDIYYSAIDTEF